MGPSGSGKTTLLNSLANHVPAKSGMKLTGGSGLMFLVMWGGQSLALTLIPKN
jgi:ABC-type phosphate/phosphonate transport system ATPase subunit